MFAPRHHLWSKSVSRCGQAVLIELRATSAMDPQSSAISQFRKPPAQLRRACTDSGERKPSVGLDGGPCAQLRSTHAELFLRRRRSCRQSLWGVLLSALFGILPTYVAAAWSPFHVRMSNASCTRSLRAIQSFSRIWTVLGRRPEVATLNAAWLHKGQVSREGGNRARFPGKSRRKFHTLPRWPGHVQSVLLQPWQWQGGGMVPAGSSVILSSWSIPCMNRDLSTPSRWRRRCSWLRNLQYASRLCPGQCRCGLSSLSWVCTVVSSSQMRGASRYG